MQIKTFEFKISCAFGNETEPSNFSSDHKTYRDGSLATTEMIDKAINKFVKGKSVVDIKVDYYTIHRHNNGYCDTIIARYTILFNAKTTTKK